MPTVSSDSAAPATNAAGVPQASATAPANRPPSGAEPAKTVT